MKVGGPLGHIKRTAKQIKKKYPHVLLTEVQKDLANYLGFTNWKHLLQADDGELQARIDKKPLPRGREI
jgi:hypothetical protein